MESFIQRKYRKYFRLAIFVIIILVSYQLFSNRYNQYKIDGYIRNTKPENVWEYVADFSKFKLLNPTILDFKITADSGTLVNWKYSVHYREKLSHWPHWINEATADYNVVRESHNEAGPFTIESHHKTCFLQGLYCLRTSANFTFRLVNQDTYYVENINYQCPPFLGSVCRREIEFQHKAIIFNLTSVFNKKHK